MQVPPQKFPDLVSLAGKIEPKLETELYLSIKRLYEYIDIKVKNALDSWQAKLGTTKQEEAINILKTDDGLKPILGSPAINGYITIRDNSGNSIKLLTTT